MIRNKGATSQSIYVVILDSTSTTGGRKTGLVFNTSGLTAYYVRQGGSATAITLATLAAANSAYSSGGFKEVDATNMPGVYRLDIPDAALASGADSVIVTLKGATGMVQVDKEIELTSVNLQDAVRGGMTALPNANAEAAGGLYTRGSGAGQINQPANGQIDANTVKVGGTTQTARDLGASVLISSGTGTGQLDVTSGVIKANLAQILGTALTETAGQIAAGFKQFFNIASPTSTMNTITTVTTATNLTTNNDKTGYTLSSAGVQAIWDALTSALTTVGSIGKRLADDIDATISSRSTYAGGDTSGVTTLLSRISAAITITGGKVDVNDKTGFSLSSAGIQAIWDALTSALTTVGSIGKLLVTNIDAAISSRSTYAGGAVASVTGSVGSVASGGISASSFAAGAIDNAAIAADAIGSSELAASAVAEIADGVWDELIAGHLGAGSTGAALNAAGSAGDPWTTPLPGAYGAGTAGNIVGNNLDTTVSSRLASGSYTTPPTVTQIRTEMDTNSTKMDVAVSTRLASASYTTPPTAVQNRQEMDSNSTKLANLDATVSSRSTLTAANVWAYVIEGSLTAQGVFRLILASVVNKLSGAATTTIKIRDLADTKDRITATVDADGNRSSVSVDAS